MKFNATPATVWSRPAYLPYVHSPLTDEVIREAEKQFGCKLPADFLDVLRVQNGGPIRFRNPDSVGSMIAGIGSGFPSISSFYLAEHQEYVDFPLEGLVAFDGDGHWFLCLDYRENSNSPTVSYVDVECNSQSSIADSFSGFLNLLELEIEDERLLKGVANIEDARTQLEALFGKKFKRKVSNVGIEYWFCRTDEASGDCCWISSNQVAGGYSGDKPKSFQFQDEALLFPELPPNAVIFETPSDRLGLYAKKLGGAGIEVVEIESAAI